MLLQDIVAGQLAEKRGLIGLYVTIRGAAFNVSREAFASYLR
jgi:hypothetical protein